MGYQVDCFGIRVLVFKSLLFYLVKMPKYKSSNTGNLYEPRSSLNVFPVSEKVKVLNLKRKENKNHMLSLLSEEQINL